MKARVSVLVTLAALLALLPALPGRTAFAGRNRRVVFAQFASGNYDLFTVRSDGTGVKRLTNSNRYETDPSFSPNGRWIAFTASVGSDFEIFKIRSSGEDLTRLTDNDVNDYDPTWSPSGERIAFIRQRLQTGEPRQ